MILLCGSFRLCFRLFIGLYVRLRKLISLGCSTLVTSLGCLGSSFGPLVAGCLKNFLSYCYIATYRAMLTCGKTVFGTSRINSCIIDLGVAESGDYNVLSVGKLSKCYVGKYRLTLCAEPIFDLTVSGASRCNCLYVLNACGVRNYNVLSISELGKRCVSEYCVTLVTDPMLNKTCLMTSCFYCVYMSDGRCVKGYKILNVGELSKSRISEYCVTVGAVPICLATVLMAGCRR